MYIVMLGLACGPIMRSFRNPELPRRAQTCAILSWFTSAPVCPRVRVLPWLVAAGGGEERRGSVLYSNCVAVVGKGSASDSVVCVCLASASLNKQWLGWALLCPVFAVERGRVRECVRRGRRLS